MNRFKITRILYWGFVVVFFALATAGYLVAGESLDNSVYYAIQMFLMEYSEVENGNILINIGRFLCPIMTATGIFALLRNFFRAVADGIVSRMKDATAVYYDTGEMCELGKGFKHPILMGKKVNKKAKAHVLMFDKDIDNLTFYGEMEKNLEEGSKVYIKLEEMESKLLKKSKVYYFNINEIIARRYWQERNLLEYLADGKMNMKIAIIGFDALGQNILDYGLMNNIYSLKQSIQYHVWGESRLYRNMLGDFDKMNGDTITYHDTDWREDVGELKGFDRIIIAQETSIEMIQALLYLSCDAEIDFYNPSGAELPAVYMGDKLTAFGVLENVLTEETIKTDKLYRSAKEINYNYEVTTDTTGTYTWTRPDVEEVMEEKWEELSGFHKGSNVACADYHNIRLLIMASLGMDKAKLTEEQEEMLAEMEHVRWSRYHYVNHWHYSEKRDNSKRLHHLLVPYDKLPQVEKQKDRDAVKGLLKERG